MGGRYLQRWRLRADGAPIVTHSAHLQPVLTTEGLPAMLKMPRDVAEVAPAVAALGFWAGDAAVRLLIAADHAMLLERIIPGKSLCEWPFAGNDQQATTLLCDTAARLHRAGTVPAGLIPLRHGFDALLRPVMPQPVLLQDCAGLAGQLLAQEWNPVVLHGDLHHGNLLDGGPRGWVAIDPKGVYGESAFDYAPQFLNPDLGSSGRPFATVAAHFDTRLMRVSRLSAIPEQRLLQWIAAYAGLSASWFLEDGQDAGTSLAIASLALARLGT